MTTVSIYNGDCSIRVYATIVTVLLEYLNVLD